jgi:hypothetical protein
VATRAAQRRLAAASGGLALILVAGSAAQTQTHLHPVLLHVIGTRIYAGSRPLTAGAQPTWSPDGSQIAFVRGQSVWTANADGSGRREIAPGTAPSWTAGGELAYVRGGRIVVGRRRVLSGHNPAFARDGRLAYDRNGSVWAAGVRLTLGTDPAWAPNSRSLAFVRDGSLFSIGAGGEGETLLVDAGDVSEPSWSPDGRQVLFVSGDAIHAVTVSDSSVVRVARGVSPDLAMVPRGREILPDLKQLPPTDIYITHRPGYRLLAFRSAAANIGRGTLWIRGRRPTGHRLMDVTQLIRRTDGTVHEMATNGWMRYDVMPTHSHWHFHPFERYELWYPGGHRPVARDHKQGFCLGDRHPLASARPPHFMPGECGLFEPHARSVEEGISPRYVDIYPPEYHGQWIIVNGLRDGRYVLVHRVNPAFALRESNYANNEASALIDIHGDSVRVLKTCPTSVTCARYGQRR